MAERVPGDKLEGGRADRIPLSAFESAAVLKGSQHEREHTSDPAIAKEIARDHLAEDKNYYEKLDKLEKSAYEHGALYAVKLARVGGAVPTGYKFELDPSWTGGLDPDAQARAQSAAAQLTAWLQAHGELGSHYAQHPEFARQVATLGRIGRKPVAPAAPVAPTGFL